MGSALLSTVGRSNGAQGHWCWSLLPLVGVSWMASGMTAKARLQDFADVQRLIQQHHLTADFAKQLHPYVRRKFLELLS